MLVQRPLALFFMDLLENLAKTHPDEGFRDVAEKFLKTLTTWTKKRTGEVSQDKLKKEAVNRILKFIEDMEKAHLIEPTKVKLIPRF